MIKNITFQNKIFHQIVPLDTVQGNFYFSAQKNRQNWEHFCRFENTVLSCKFFAKSLIISQRRPVKNFKNVSCLISLVLAKECRFDNPVEFIFAKSPKKFCSKPKSIVYTCNFCKENAQIVLLDM